MRKKKAVAEQEYRNSMPASSYQQQKLRVCEVCSAYLGIHDNDRRLADHFGGKLHLGFITIREKLADLKVKPKKMTIIELGDQHFGNIMYFIINLKTIACYYIIFTLFKFILILNLLASSIYIMYI